MPNYREARIAPGCLYTVAVSDLAGLHLKPAKLVPLRGVERGSGSGIYREGRGSVLMLFPLGR